MYTIRFKNSAGIFITKEEALVAGEYKECYYENGVLNREVAFYNGKPDLEYVHNRENEEHQLLITKYPEAIIVDHIQYRSGYRLEKLHGYDEHGVLSARTHSVYDTNEKLIAHEVVFGDEEEEIHQRRKEYWDININPTKEVFHVSYYRNIEVVECLYFNNEHENNSGQDAFSLGLKEIDKVIEITGMSKELAIYYFTPDVIPNWRK